MANGGKKEIKGWPPRYLSKVSDADYKRSRGENTVDFAEALSENTCEVCGSPGLHRNSGWIKTYCDMHHREREDSVTYYKKMGNTKLSDEY